jgi:heptose III glucuronosyltransferase
MRLSIIIPVFNAGDYLQPLLDSLAALRPPDIEFVAIDDGSTDRSLETLTAFATHEPRLRIISQANAGVAVARNRGLQAARGEYVWFVDADDLIVAPAVQALHAAAMSGADVITFNGQRFGDGYGETGGVGIYQRVKPSSCVSGEEWLVTLLTQKELRHFVWLHWCRREYLQTIELTFNAASAPHEDVVWVTEVTLRAPRLQYVDVIAYRYRINAASATGSSEDARLMRNIRSYFTVVPQMQDMNRRISVAHAARASTLFLLRGEVVGQALQVFELSKQLQSDENRLEVIGACRKRRFAQGLWRDALNFKRKRQVVAIWLKQSGLLPPGRASAK